MLSFATVIAVTFTIAELMLMSNKNYVFATFNSPSIADRWNDSQGAAIPLTDQALVVYFGSERILLGSAASLTAPAPNSGMVMLPRDSWRQNIENAVMNAAAARGLFPVSSVGIAFSGSDATQAEFSDVLGVVHALRRLNERFGGKQSAPVATYFVDISGGLVGVN